MARAIRPTTDKPVAWVSSANRSELEPLLEWLKVDRTVAHDGEALADVAILDLPDVDSVRAEHRAMVDALLPRIDAVTWIVDPEKYDDAAVHAYWRTLAPHADRLRFVLNKADRLTDERPARGHRRPARSPDGRWHSAPAHPRRLGDDRRRHRPPARCPGRCGPRQGHHRGQARDRPGTRRGAAGRVGRHRSGNRVSAAAGGVPPRNARARGRRRRAGAGRPRGPGASDLGGRPLPRPRQWWILLRSHRGARRDGHAAAVGGGRTRRRICADGAREGRSAACSTRCARRWSRPPPTCRHRAAAALLEALGAPTAEADVARVLDRTVAAAGSEIEIPRSPIWPVIGVLQGIVGAVLLFAAAWIGVLIVAGGSVPVGTFEAPLIGPIPFRSPCSPARSSSAASWDGCSASTRVGSAAGSPLASVRARSRRSGKRSSATPSPGWTAWRRRGRRSRGPDA